MPVSSALRLVPAAVAACFALAASLVGAAPARADDPVFDRAFGAGPADICTTSCRPGSNGGSAGQFNLPYGVAVSGGEVYVVDTNQRINVFAADGTFVRAFGKGVNPGPGDPDICNATTWCRPGTPGGAAGQLSSPYAVAVSGGEVYVADASNNRISVYSTAGVFSRAFGDGVNPGPGDPDVCTASTTCQPGNSGGGPGQLSFPLGVAVGAGEVYVADASNNRISVYGTAGTFLRSFGTGGSGAGQLSFPFGVALGGGELYVADQNNQRVSVFNTSGTFARALGKNVNTGGGSADVCTTASGCQAGAAGGAAGQLTSPYGVAVAGGEVYVVDTNQRVSVFAGGGGFARAFGDYVNPGAGDPDVCSAASGCQAGSMGGGAGQLSNPSGVAVGGGEVFVADTTNYRVGVYSTAGGFLRAFGKSVWGSAPFVCTTLTGCVPGSAGGDAGQFDAPSGLTIAGGEAYVADTGNHRVTVFSADGAFARAFGGAVNPGAGDPDVCTAATTCRAGANGITAGRLSSPGGVAVSGGEVYVADTGNHRISVFATDGTFRRAFGKDVNSGAGNPDLCTPATGCRSGTPGGASGQLDNPVAVAVSGGEVFITDQVNRRIAVFTTAGAFVRAFGDTVNLGPGDPDVCSTACRTANEGSAAGQLSSPFGLAVSGSEVYVADYFNARVSVFATDGTFARAFGRNVNPGAGGPDVCTAATGCQIGSQGGTAGELSGPIGIAVGDGAVYVSEQFSARVSVFGTDGVFARAFGWGVNAAVSGNPDVCTPATTCRAAAQGDAAGQFSEPRGVALNGTTIYTADRLNHRIAVFRVPRTELSRDPVTLAFGRRDIDDGATATKVSTVSNTGTEPVRLAGLTLAGDASQFGRLTGAAGDCAVGLLLAPGQTCAVRLRFDPTSTGGKAATFTVTSNAPPVTVALTGAGTQTQLSRAPAALAFGPQDVDDGAAADQSTTISNTGTEPVTLTGLALTGDAAQFGRLSGAASDCTPTTRLTAGEGCVVRVRFDPATTGPKAAVLTATSNAAPITVTLTGTGIQTRLGATPTTLAFGRRDLYRGPAPTQTTTVANIGTEPVTLTALTLAGDSEHFARLTGAAGDCAAATRLDAGETCAVRVQFDPATAGAKSATLTVKSNAAPVAVGLTGRGVRTRLSRAPAALAFGPREVDDGATAVQTSTITNTGSEPVTLDALTLAGDGADFARLTGAPGDCEAEARLAVDETCVVRLRFDPTTTGPREATLTVTSGAPAVAVALSGTGTRTALSRDPGTLAFGIRDVDQGPTAPQTATIANTGTEPVVLTGLTLSGESAHFVRMTGVDGDCTATTELAVGETCALRLRFDPVSVGGKAATLTVTSNAPPVVVGLTGSGIQTQISSDPPSLAFGTRDLDEGPVGHAATIANTGSEPVTIERLTLSGDPGQFSRPARGPGDCAGGTRLAAGETCTLRARFDPSSTGAKVATITVTSNAPALVVGLAGSGTTTKADADGDGTPDAEDADDDNDGVPDDQDAFPRDGSEWVDTDGDGTGNNADTDDDNDGAPDDRDVFPLDPTRQTATPEPVPPPPPPVQAPVVPAAQRVFAPWRLKKRGRVRVVVRKGAVRVESGYVATCPADGPQCTGRVTLKHRRRSARTRKVVPIFLTGRTKPMTIAPGGRRRLTFRLSARGTALLYRLGSFAAVMRGTVRTGDQPAVAHRAKLRLVAPLR